MISPKLTRWSVRDLNSLRVAKLSSSFLGFGFRDTVLLFESSKYVLQAQVHLRCCWRQVLGVPKRPQCQLIHVAHELGCRHPFVFAVAMCLV